jgi:hypothetical protein
VAPIRFVTSELHEVHLKNGKVRSIPRALKPFKNLCLVRKTLVLRRYDGPKLSICKK